MEFLKIKIQLTKLFFRASVTIFTAGFGWLVVEFRKTEYILSHAFDTNLLDQIDAESCKSSPRRSYIYLERAKWRMSNLWRAMLSSYSLKLLNVAKSENREYRLKATRALANMKYLRDWDYKYLAQICDAKTAVALARHEHSDLRLFMGPPNRLVASYAKLMKCIKYFILSLDERASHACLQYCISNVFQDSTSIIDDDSTSVEVSKELQTTDAVLPICLRTILHHASMQENAKDIVDLNGLPLLMEVHQRYPDNLSISITLAKVISHVSVFPEYLDELFHTGWIGVLAKWARNSNLMLSMAASRALANLDDDYLDNGKFHRKVYVLHPIFRKKFKPDIDVILVHGLLGGVFFTWRQRDRRDDDAIGLIGKRGPSTESLSRHDPKTSDPKTQEYVSVMREHKQQEWEAIGSDFDMVMHDCPVSNLREALGSYSYSERAEDYDEEFETNMLYTYCWPRDWLPKDCSRVRVIGLNYDTTISMWAPTCPKQKYRLTLEDRSQEFKNKLIEAKVGERPIVWICHSMGGLLVKNMLVNASASEDENERKLLENTKGIMFYSTPHSGSKFAAITPTTSYIIWPTIEVQELRENSPALLTLHQRFLEMLKTYKMQIVSFAETKSTLISAMHFHTRFVEHESADPGVGEFYDIPLDHLNICKPKNRQSFIYQRVVDLVNNICGQNCTTATNQEKRTNGLIDILLEKIQTVIEETEAGEDNNSISE